MSTDVPTFGQTAADDVPAFSGDQWIRTFREASTQIRICPFSKTNNAGETVTGYRAWPSELEHYDEDLQVSFPCVNTKEHGNLACPGCQSTSKRTRDRGRKYYVNALVPDEDGNPELRIFKFGGTVWDVFKMRQDRMMAAHPDNDQPLSDRDYVINKSGTALKTKYDVESGDAYEMEFPAEMHDIPAAISASWHEAMELYGGDTAIDGTEEPPEAAPRRMGAPAAAQEEPPESTPPRRIGQPAGAAKKAAPAAKKAAPAARKMAAAAPADENPPPAAQNGMTMEDLEDLGTEDIRAWVDKASGPSYELPAKAPRSRLLTIAGHILEGQDPPF